MEIQPSSLEANTDVQSSDQYIESLEMEIQPSSEANTDDNDEFSQFLEMQREDRSVSSEANTFSNNADTSQFLGVEIQPSSENISPLYIDIDVAEKKWFPRQRQMHKVLPQLRLKKSSDGPSVYDPIMVSLGPYHHGKVEFVRAEEFKENCLHWCTNGCDEDKGRYYNMIFSKIDEIRDCYAEVSFVNKYDDDALARMMLLDASFIINFMEIHFSDEMAKYWYSCLGVAGVVPFAARDILVLENQIPFFVLELLVSEMYEQGEGKKLLRYFLGSMVSMELKLADIPGEDNNPPIHILEAFRRVLLGKVPTTEQGESPERYPITKGNEMYPPEHIKHRALSFPLPRKKEQGKRIPRYRQRTYAKQAPNWILRCGDCFGTRQERNTGASMNFGATKKAINYHITCPSAMDLKAKGIRFHPSSSHIITNIKFDSRGLLHLPVCYVSDLTLACLSNTIAYEMAPDNVKDTPDLAVLSYANLMKSLIQTPSDVRELQKKKVLLLNRIGNLEQVVELFKSIDTFNLQNAEVYNTVMCRVGKHCDNKLKTWMAELIHSKLRSPWTIIALLIAAFIVILTFLQTYYTMKPRK